MFPNTRSSEISSKISELTCRASELSQTSERLASKLTELDHFFQGGLRWGELSEWGTPWGGGCREVPLRFLQAAHQQASPPWCLWVYDQEEVSIYPPAWQARGIDLKLMRFAKSSKPIQELKLALSSGFFKLIVLDCVNPIGRDDCCFLAQQAKSQQSIIMLLRHYYLSTGKGNVWAKTRINCWHDPLRDCFRIRSVKGLRPKQLNFRLHPIDKGTKI